MGMQTELTRQLLQNRFSHCLRPGSCQESEIVGGVGAHSGCHSGCHTVTEWQTSECCSQTYSPHGLHAQHIITFIAWASLACCKPTTRHSLDQAGHATGLSSLTAVPLSASSALFEQDTACSVPSAHTTTSMLHTSPLHQVCCASQCRSTCWQPTRSPSSAV